MAIKHGLLLVAALPLLIAADRDVPELLLPVACKIGQSCPHFWKGMRISRYGFYTK